MSFSQVSILRKIAKLEPNFENFIGIDIGGTFTDVTVHDLSNGEIHYFKDLSNPIYPEQGVLTSLIKANINYETCNLIVHGTTVGTNTLLEKNGAKTALITTKGFRDIIELGRTTRMVPHSLYNPYFLRPPPFVPRHLRFVIDERTSASGKILKIPDEMALNELIKKLKSLSVESLAICFINSYRNPENESMVAKVLKSHFKFVTYSASVVNEIREYERFMACVINAYLAPKMTIYTKKLIEKLREKNYQKSFHTMASNGSLLSENLVYKYPIRTILSGPAAGVSAASYLSNLIGLKNFITYDMGGTSTDVSLVEHNSLPIKRESIFEGIIIKIPQIDIQTIGAGGGSIARIDSGGSLFVGPVSAGADPGPACYGRGGVDPTVTDANIVLGRLGSDQKLGGSLQLDLSKARTAIDRIAKKIGSPVEETAEGILFLTVTKMASIIYEISVGQGYDPRDFSLISYGGAGPMHAALIAEELGIPAVVIPPSPGTFSAFGGLCSNLFRERMETILIPLNRSSLLQLKYRCSEIRSELIEELRNDGEITDNIEFKIELDARFVGQAHEITINFYENISLKEVIKIYEQKYERTYGRLDIDKEIEIVNLRIRALIPISIPRLVKQEFQSKTLQTKEYRKIYIKKVWTDCPVYDRKMLDSGSTISGPSVIEEMSSTIYIPPEWNVKIDVYKNIYLNQ